jgi:hypothetical protein
MARWYVDLIGTRLHRFGTVVADTEKQALEVAVKEIGIGRARQNTLAVTKISDGVRASSWPQGRGA